PGSIVNSPFTLTVPLNRPTTRKLPLPSIFPSIVRPAASIDSALLTLLIGMSGPSIRGASGTRSGARTTGVSGVSSAFVAFAGGSSFRGEPNLSMLQASSTTGSDRAEPSYYARGRRRCQDAAGRRDGLTKRGGRPAFRSRSVGRDGTPSRIRLQMRPVDSERPAAYRLLCGDAERPEAPRPMPKCQHCAVGDP